MAEGTFQIDLQPLSPQMRRLVRALGVAATLKLLEERGGTRVYISGGRQRADRRMLKALIGAEAAEAFYAEFGAHAPELDLPKADKLLMQMRDDAIRLDKAQGLSFDLVARKYRLTRRRVIDICGEPGRPNSTAVQGDLFGTLHESA